MGIQIDEAPEGCKPKLLPCPFCGGVNVKTFGPYGWHYQWGISHSCKTFYSGSQEMAQGFQTEADAISAWNTRLGVPEREADYPSDSKDRAELALWDFLEREEKSKMPLRDDI